MVPGLDEGDHIERSVELSVAAAVEAHALCLSGAGRDGCHAGEHGEGVRRAEAGDVAGFADQLGDGQHTRTRESEQGMVADALSELCLKLARLGQQPLEPGQPPTGQLRLEAGQASQQAANGWPSGSFAKVRSASGEPSSSTAQAARDRL